MPARIQAYLLGLKLILFSLGSQFAVFCVSQLLPDKTLARLLSKPSEKNTAAEMRRGADRDTRDTEKLASPLLPRLEEYTICSRPFKVRTDNLGAGPQKNSWLFRKSCSKCASRGHSLCRAHPRDFLQSSLLHFLSPRLTSTKPQIPRAAYPNGRLV